MNDQFQIIDMNGGKTLNCSGSLNIMSTGSLREVMHELHQQGGSVSLNLKNVTDIDLTFLQLVCSAHRTYVASGQTFRISEDLPESQQKIVEEAGYERHRGCQLDQNNSCVWVRRDKR